MKLKITLTKSPIAALQVHKDTVAALGLRNAETVAKMRGKAVEDILG